MFVKPTAGRAVRDPVKGTLLPEDWTEVPDSDLFWHRRLRDGDVVQRDEKDGKKSSKAPVDTGNKKGGEA